jgi:hypothetical protein
MSELYSKMEMIDAIREFLGKEGFTVWPDYDSRLEPARVPIFATKGKGKGAREIFVDIITERTITLDDYFKERAFGALKGDITIDNASSAQFFRHYFPFAEVYWAIPSYVDKNGDLIKFRKKCKKGNIGLYEVEKVKEGDGEKFIVTVLQGPPSSLLAERVQSTIKQISDEIEDKEMVKNLTDLFTKYCQDDISYLVFYPQPTYLATDISIRDYKLSISRQLILKMGDLQNVSYKDELIEFGKSYFRQKKAVDDYKIAFDITRKLWSKYDLQFPNLHLDFESILKLDPRYRDHFLHAFQVFLFGVYVIDSMYAEARGDSFGDDEGDRIEDAWLFAATYHDFNYMVQKFDEWTKTFFQNALHLEAGDKNPASLHLSESYVLKGYMLNTKKLAEMLHIEKMDQIVLNFFYDRILEKKNHGVISCLSLLKYLDNKSDHRLSGRVVDAACKAIAIHDKHIWKYLCGISVVKGDDDRGNAFKEKQIIKELSFSHDPVPFLLILIDNIQEDARSRDDKLKVELEKVECGGGEMRCEITFEGNGSEEAYRDKEGDLDDVKRFLKGNMKFIITMTNKDAHKEIKITV